jgi:hypothetical protein
MSEKDQNLAMLNPLTEGLGRAMSVGEFNRMFDKEL